MPHEPTRPNEIPDDELIAYLDGELAGDDLRRLDRRLADDPELQKRLQQLQQSWDLLDALPRAHPTQEFTSSTLEMAALTAEAEVKIARQTGQLTQVAWWVGGGALALGAAAIAFLLTQANITRPDRELAQDLPVIERLDQYRYVDSVEFLERLEKEGLFNSEENDAL